MPDSSCSRCVGDCGWCCALSRARTAQTPTINPLDPHPPAPAQVAAHASPEQVLEAVQVVLDEDADSFVTKLFQVLIYESLKLEHGL